MCHLFLTSIFFPLSHRRNLSFCIAESALFSLTKNSIKRLSGRNRRGGGGSVAKMFVKRGLSANSLVRSLLRLKSMLEKHFDSLARKSSTHFLHCSMKRLKPVMLKLRFAEVQTTIFISNGSYSIRCSVTKFLNSSKMIVFQSLSIFIHSAIIGQEMYKSGIVLWL